MTLTDLLITQLTDPFRIGLIIALAVTAARTQAVTGRVLPLLAGLAFVAIIIPTTMQTGNADPVWRLVAVGFVVNAALLAIVLAAWSLVRRLRG